MITFPIVKLSVAEDVEPDQLKFTWHHEAKQLHFVLDNYGTHGSSQLLKVVQGTQIRQKIEVERLVNEGKAIMQTVTARSIQLTAEQLPISAIIKCPLLAIRWQLPNKKIRRAQLKFRSSSDFNEAYNHLHQLGLYMTSPNDSQAKIRSPTLLTQQSVARPVTSNLPVVPRFRQPSSEGLTCPPSRLAEITTRPYTANNSAAFFTSGSQNPGTRSNSAFVSYSEDDYVKPTLATNPLVPPMLFPRPNSATSNVLDNASNRLHSSGGDSASPVFRDYELHRPETAMLLNRPDSAGTLLPPKRELPFQRSNTLSAGSDSVRPSSRPSTCFMGPPPLPARVADLRPNSSQGFMRGNELPPLPQPTFLSPTLTRSSQAQHPPRTPNQENESATHHLSSSSERTENQQLRQSPSDLSSPLFKKADRMNSPAIQPLDLLTGPAQNLHRVPSQIRSTSSYAVALDPTRSRDLDTSLKINPEDIERLAAYVMQSAEIRRANMNEVIFHLTADDNFITLAEDVETCWARVGLGMR